MLLSRVNAKNVTLENKRKKNVIPLIWQNVHENYMNFKKLTFLIYSINTFFSQMASKGNYLN